MKLILALMMAAVLPAQDQRETRIFQLKYANAGALSVSLSLFGAEIRHVDELRTITVNAPGAIMRQIEEAVKRFDVPPPATQNVEVTIYVLGTAAEGTTGLTPELEGVAKQLGVAFGHRNLHLIDTQVIRTREGRGGEVSAPVGFGKPQKIASYRFSRATISTDEKGRAIRLDGLKLGMKVPVPAGEGKFQYADTGVGTDIDVREGQKAVVGKTLSQGAAQSSFFVVMAKVVE